MSNKKAPHRRGSGARGLTTMRGVVKNVSYQTHTVILSFLNIRCVKCSSHTDCSQFHVGSSLVVGLIRDATRLEDSAGAVRNRYSQAMAWLRRVRRGFRTVINGLWVSFAPAFTIGSVT